MRDRILFVTTIRRREAQEFGKGSLSQRRGIGGHRHFSIRRVEEEE